MLGKNSARVDDPADTFPESFPGGFSPAATLEGFHHRADCCNAQSAADGTTFSDSLLMTALSLSTPPVGATQRRGAAACQPRTSSQSRKGAEPRSSPVDWLPGGLPARLPAKRCGRFCLTSRGTGANAAVLLRRAKD